METKYFAVEWPEYQLFMDYPKFREECFYCSDSNIYFIPEDLYYDRMKNVTSLPEEYNNFTEDFDEIKRDQNVLIYTTDGFKIIKSLTNWKSSQSLPVLLEEGYLNGLNCNIVAVEKNIQD